MKFKIKDEFMPFIILYFVDRAVGSHNLTIMSKNVIQVGAPALHHTMPVRTGRVEELIGYCCL